MKDIVEFDDFAKLDLQVGVIKSVKDHPNADKLLVMEVDLGEGEARTIVAGIKAFYSKEELEGKQAVFVANLKPATLRGVESQGMILAVGSKEEGTCVFLQPEKEVKAGDRIS